MVTGVIEHHREPKNASKQHQTASKLLFLGSYMSACLSDPPASPKCNVVMQTPFSSWGMIQTEPHELKDSL